MNIKLSHPCNKLPPVPHQSKHKHISSWFIKSSANPNRFVPFRPWNLPEFERLPPRSAARNYRRTLSLFHVRYPVAWTHTLTIVNLQQLLTNDNKRERLCRAKCNSFTNYVWKVADWEFTFMYLGFFPFPTITLWHTTVGILPQTGGTIEEFFFQFFFFDSGSNCSSWQSWLCFSLEAGQNWSCAQTFLSAKGMLKDKKAGARNVLWTKSSAQYATCNMLHACVLEMLLMFTAASTVS